MKRFLFLVVFMFSSASAYSQQMIANITDSVKTDFGTYHPYAVNVTPACTTYTVDSGFSNVPGFNYFSFSAGERNLLRNNAFVATPSDYMEMYDIYNNARVNGVPIFVSCDAFLNTYHILYDKLLQTIEVEKLVGDIKNLTDTLYSKIKQEWDSTNTASVKEALRLDIAYLSIAKKLLDSTFTQIPEVAALVDTELALIYAHQGYATSPLFAYSEDYSQYVPRGHYTKSDTLMKYFRTMMWYGRMIFGVNTNTRMAALLIHGIHNVNVGSETGIKVWERVYLPTVFFVGKTDDINIYQYSQIMEEVYGSNFASLPPDTFANDALLNEFISKADSLPDPAIPTAAPKGFAFMSQRFIPDSWMFSQLTFDRIPGARMMPKGLDVMAVLGSDEAYTLLDSVYGETSYSGYASQMTYLKGYFDALPDATWAQNLYWNWLYCLMPFTFEKGTGFPIFMQSKAWTHKELYAALGSWAQLRHDTILYAKQSASLGMPSSSPTVHGYVEPNPWFFARLASLANYMKTGLKSLDLISNDFEARLTGLEKLLLVFKTISEEELTNQSITDKEDNAITGVGAEMAKLVLFEGCFQYYGSHTYTTEFNYGDDQMPVIADVHTADASCLEEGVGYPFNLYVIVPLNGVLTVTWGAGFSYYEFTRPSSNRLTDGEWQSILQTNPPDVPVWAASFIDTTQLGAITSPQHFISSNYWDIQDFEPGVEEPSILDRELRNAELKILKNKIYLSVPNNYYGTSGTSRSGVNRLGGGTNILLTIYDLTGRLQNTVYQGTLTKGNYTFTPNIRKSGIYFVRLTTGNCKETKKLILIK
ncbi:MAG: DUF3160 domain-containing protein [bacterium]